MIQKQDRKLLEERIENYKRRASELSPEEMLDVFSCKKIAMERKLDTLLLSIEELEKGYYKDYEKSCTLKLFEPVFRGVKRLTLEEAKTRIEITVEFAERYNLGLTADFAKGQVYITELELGLC